MSRIGHHRPDLHAPSTSQEIVETYRDASATIPELAKMFGTSYCTISRILKANGEAIRLPRAGRYKSLSKADRRKAAAAWLRGTPAEILESTYRVNLQTLRRYASECFPGQRRVRKSRDDRATRIQRDYMTAPDAADELGISRFTLYEYLNAGKFPGAFRMGNSGRFWLIPRDEVTARRERISARNKENENDE